MPTDVRNTQFEAYSHVKPDEIVFRSLDEIENAITEALSETDFATATKLLNVHKDLSQGIRADFITVDGDLNLLYLRDSRNPRELVGPSHYQNWAIMGLNYINTVKMLLESQEKDVDELI